MITESRVTTTIRQTAVVGPGGVVMVRQPWLTPGAEVQVEIVVAGPLYTQQEMSSEELSTGLVHALNAAGIDSPEKIVALMQEVKREQFLGRFGAMTSNSKLDASASGND